MRTPITSTGRKVRQTIETADAARAILSKHQGRSPHEIEVIKSGNEAAGRRFRECRDAAELTQEYVAKSFGIKRSAVAQWESGSSAMSVYVATRAAKLFTETGKLKVTPEWLAFGIDGNPKVITKLPDGTVGLKEVSFGETPDEQLPAGFWSVPVDYLKGDLHVLATEGLIIWRTESDSMAPTYEYGDRLIVDTNAKRASPPGAFLIWDGIGPTLAHITVIQATEAGQYARVSSSLGADGDRYEVAVEKLNIIGRVKGRIHAS